MTLTLPFVQARHYRRARVRPVRLIVLHDMEFPERLTAAEDVARYFATTDRAASAHVNVDADSIVQCVREADTAFAAKGANADGLHIEHAGYARQSSVEWLDAYGRSMLARSAGVAAGWCVGYGIPVVRLTLDEVRGGRAKGLTDHATVTAAFPPGTGHTDPGPRFPWNHYLELVRAAVSALSPTPVVARPVTPPMEDDMPVIARARGDKTAYLTDLLTAKRSLDDPAELAELKAIGVRDVGEVEPRLLLDVRPVAG